MVEIQMIIVFCVVFLRKSKIIYHIFNCFSLGIVMSIACFGV